MLEPEGVGGADAVVDVLAEAGLFAVEVALVVEGGELGGGDVDLAEAAVRALPDLIVLQEVEFFEIAAAADFASHSPP